MRVVTVINVFSRIAADAKRVRVCMTRSIMLWERRYSLKKETVQLRQLPKSTEIDLMVIKQYLLTQTLTNFPLEAA